MDAPRLLIFNLNSNLLTIFAVICSSRSWKSSRQGLWNAASLLSWLRNLHSPSPPLPSCSTCRAVLWSRFVNPRTLCYSPGARIYDLPLLPRSTPAWPRNSCTHPDPKTNKTPDMDWGQRREGLNRLRFEWECRDSDIPPERLGCVKVWTPRRPGARLAHHHILT